MQLATTRSSCRVADVRCTEQRAQVTPGKSNRLHGSAGGKSLVLASYLRMSESLLHIASYSVETRFAQQSPGSSGSARSESGSGAGWRESKEATALLRWCASLQVLSCCGLLLRLPPPPRPESYDWLARTDAGVHLACASLLLSSLRCSRMLPREMDVLMRPHADWLELTGVIGFEEKLTDGRLLRRGETTSLLYPAREAKKSTSTMLSTSMPCCFASMRAASAGRVVRGGAIER